MKILGYCQIIPKILFSGSPMANFKVLCNERCKSRHGIYYRTVYFQHLMQCKSRLKTKLCKDLKF